MKRFLINGLVTSSSLAQNIMSLNFTKNIGFRAFFFLLLLAASGSSLAVPPYQSVAPNHHIMVFNRSWSPFLDQYQYDVIKTILDHSQKNFGEYSLAKYPGGTSVVRALQLSIERNVSFAEITTSNLEEHEEHHELIQLPYQFFGGLLGLRKLVVKNSKYHDFSQVRSPEEFLKYSVGQRYNWPDIQTYRSSGIRVVEGQTFNNMFAMLRADRFDYLPLSVLEADASFEKSAQPDAALSLHDKLYIYYPMAVYLKVHQSQIDRFKDGLRVVEQNGALAGLFDKYFSSYIDALPSADATVVVIANPSLSAEQNREMINHTLTRHLGEGKIIINLKSAFYPKVPDFTSLSLL